MLVKVANRSYYTRAVVSNSRRPIQKSIVAATRSLRAPLGCNASVPYISWTGLCPTAASQLMTAKSSCMVHADCLDDHIPMVGCLDASSWPYQT
jgi:hypothetical protein